MGRLSCRAVLNDSDVEIVWYKGKRAVGDLIANGNQRLTEARNGDSLTLRIRQVEESDAGTYYCVIRRSRGHGRDLAKKGIKLVVSINLPEPLITPSSVHDIVFIGRGISTVLTCSIMSGPLTVAIRWMRVAPKSSTIPNPFKLSARSRSKERVFMLRRGAHMKLHMNNVTKAESGVYRCSVYDGTYSSVGDSRTSVIKIVGKEPL